MRISFIAGLMAASALLPTIAFAQDGRGDRGRGGGEYRGARQNSSQQVGQDGGQQRQAWQQRQEARQAPAQPVQQAPQAAPAPQRDWNAERGANRGQAPAPQRDTGAYQQQRELARAQQRQQFQPADGQQRGAFGQNTGQNFGRNPGLNNADGRNFQNAQRGLQDQRDRANLQRDRGNDGRGDGRFGNDGRGGNGRFDNDGRNGRPDFNRQQGRNNNDWRDNGRNQRQFDSRQNWNRDWRRDSRYDWNRYRNSNRGAFNLPRYYAPNGWGYGYRRFSIGITLNSILFNQNYWIDEPEYYRLPPAYGPYRWVRYYNDALLVDIRSGFVVDTIYDIFW